MLQVTQPWHAKQCVKVLRCSLTLNVWMEIAVIKYIKYNRMPVMP